MEKSLITPSKNSVQLLSQVPHENVWLANYISPQTKNTYSIAVREFIAFLGISSAAELKKVDQAHIIAWRDDLINKGLAPRTVNTKISALSSLFDFLCEKQELSRNATTGVQRPRINAREVQAPILTPEQVRKMLDAPDRETLQGLRDRAFLHIFFYTGCRISEVAKLLVKNLYEDGGYWVLNFTIKGGKRNKIAIHKECELALHQYLAERAESEEQETLEANSPLLHSTKPEGKNISRSQLHRIFHGYARKAGLPQGIRPHSARATFITQALENGASIEAVQRSVGHSKINTTQMYDKRRFHHRESASFAVRW